MSVIKKWLPVLIVFIAIASMGALFECSGKQTEMGQTRSEVKASETVAAVKETVAESKVNDTQTEILGITWVVYQYQRADGTVQELDINDPAQRMTIIFEENKITAQTGDLPTQVGTYEWYIKDQSLDNIFVHWEAAVSPDKKIEVGASDVHYNLLFEPRVNDWQLTMKGEETGIVFKMKVDGQ